MTLLDIYRNWAHIPNIEPVKRNKDGLRWISHRFPIKGGITWRDTLLRDMSQPNPFLKMIRIKDE